ncbi:MAG TPA: serine/threonine-protein kinase, partial [Polyangiaceae bacterium]|nr:serine/threonine-protein kinase [Polyangiaceae bacterium]
MSLAGLTAGTKLGRYELLRPIADGGMASVWAARLMGTHGFQKLVAVKVMHPALREEPDAVRMFLAEASLVAGIHHQNVIEVLDLGEENETLFLVMEWIHGAALSTVMTAASRQNDPLPIPVAVRIARGAAAGLHAAHRLVREDGTPLCLVHRDVSPHNILVGFNGVPKVVDFGIAKVTTEALGHTEFGVLKGKVPYMAPEQLRSEPLDPRADLFSLGIVLYQMTTGSHPFRRPGEAREAVAATLSADAPTRPSALVPGYPAKLEAVVMRALEKSKEARHASAEEFELDLARALPPSPREGEMVRDYVRKLLPDAYEKGLDLARAAMSPT